jgi:hypothetical protein
VSHLVLVVGWQVVITMLLPQSVVMHSWSSTVRQFTRTHMPPLSVQRAATRAPWITTR